MGLILGALAGAGAQAIDIADKSMTQDQALEREKFTSDLALERAKALEVAKVELGNNERQQQVARVRGEAERMADDKLAPKIAQEKAGIVDRAAWTPEQQAAVDQSNQIDRSGIVDRAVQDGSAAIRTGDIAPKDALATASKQEINQLKLDSLLARAEDRNVNAKEIAEIRAQATRDSAELRVRAAEQRAANGKIDRATGRMLITSEDANIKAATNQMQMLGRELENVPRSVGGKPNPKIEDINAQMKALREDIEESKAKKNSYLEELGIVKPKAKAADAPAAAPAPVPSALPPNLPSGSKQIGTSGGKPVYQAPDGKKYIVQ